MALNEVDVLDINNPTAGTHLQHSPRLAAVPTGHDLNLIVLPDVQSPTH
jgi:hypothetical protein